MDDTELLDYLSILLTMVIWWVFYFLAHPPTASHEAKPIEASSSGPKASTAGREVDRTASSIAPLEQILNRICKASGYKTIETFLAGARASYELITKAFAHGDVSGLEYLLSRSVREAFVRAMEERKQKGEHIDLTFVGIKTVEIAGASIEAGIAAIEVRFVAEMVWAGRNREGEIVEGDARQVTDFPAIWTFERQLDNPDPAWVLTEIEAGSNLRRQALCRPQT